MKKILITVSFLFSLKNSFATPQLEPYCLSRVDDVVLSIVEVLLNRKGIPLHTIFQDYSGPHEKRYSSYATVGPGGMVAEYETKVVEFESPSTKCEIISIQKIQ